MKSTPTYSTCIRDDKQVRHYWLQSACSSCTYLENYVSRTLLQVREMLTSLFDDADTSDLGERDGFMVAGNWDVVVLRIGTFEARGLYEHEESIPAEAAQTERRGRH